ncbi:EamA family transporter [Paenibacillus hamazuiensis]|uniref:EamA family transporter n=1 Tax=Paenibacillus hamazuiensis TaxID=2936508 RepID=UPI00200CDA69|nr:DMT family transporter [Paenibacillus hamazuiensis]
MGARWLAILLVIIGSSSYGLLSAIVKIVYTTEGWSDAQVTPAQITMGGVILWLILLCQPKAWSNPFKGPWIQLALVGIFGLALCTVFYNKSLSELDASVSIVLLFQFTWMTIAMEAIHSRKWPKPNQWIAVGMIMVGTAMSVNVMSADWGRFTAGGVLFGLLAALAYSLFLFFTGKIKTDMHPFMKSAVMVTASLPVLYLLYPPSAPVAGGWGSWLLWGAALGMLGQAIPTIAFNIGIPRIGSSLAAMLGSMELPAAVLAAFFLLGETVHGVQWFGMLFILAGISISERK